MHYALNKAKECSSSFSQQRRGTAVVIIRKADDKTNKYKIRRDLIMDLIADSNKSARFGGFKRKSSST